MNHQIIKYLVDREKKNGIKTSKSYYREGGKAYQIYTDKKPSVILLLINLQKVIQQFVTYNSKADLEYVTYDPGRTKILPL